MECHFANAAVSGGSTSSLPTGANTPNYWDCQQSPSAGVSRPLKAELWRIAQLGDKPRHTWNDAVGAVAQGAVAQGHGEGRRHQAALARSFLGGKDLDASIARSIDRITDAKLAQGASNAR
jgi:hypothetical protein